ncbi:head-tail connector protein [Sphingopyxis solisilvae]|uniref:head-tail connector protein n=1 Tax=Sphingopyxis solisilvae TaxID=1886788 RepID=UPI0018929450|nr:hypothetical protein [Sphingopyxis solisilvae]
MAGGETVMVMSLVPGASPVSLNEARGWLRMGGASDDAVVEPLLRAATGICEAFVGQWLVQRSGSELVRVKQGAAWLSVRPVVAVDEVRMVAADDSETVLAVDEYRLSLAADGAGRVMIMPQHGAARVRVTYRAGMAAAGADVPEAIRHGIVRMAQHLYEARDGKDVPPPPAAIAALWQPWRVLRLGGGR